MSLRVLFKYWLNGYRHVQRRKIALVSKHLGVSASNYTTIINCKRMWRWLWFSFSETQFEPVFLLYIPTEANCKLPLNFRKQFFFGEVKGRAGPASSFDGVKARKNVHVQWALYHALLFDWKNYEPCSSAAVGERILALSKFSSHPSPQKWNCPPQRRALSSISKME